MNLGIILSPCIMTPTQEEFSNFVMLIELVSGEEKYRVRPIVSKAISADVSTFDNKTETFPDPFSGMYLIMRLRPSIQ